MADRLAGASETVSSAHTTSKCMQLSINSNHWSERTVSNAMIKIVPYRDKESLSMEIHATIEMSTEVDLGDPLRPRDITSPDTIIRHQGMVSRARPTWPAGAPLHPWTLTCDVVRRSGLISSNC